MSAIWNESLETWNPDLLLVGSNKLRTESVKDGDDAVRMRMAAKGKEAKAGLREIALR